MMARFLVAVCLLLTACERDRSELYEDAAVALDWLPDHGRIEYEDRAGCLACFEEECAEEISDCQGDEACAAFHECVVSCRQPTCFSKCWALWENLDPSTDALQRHPLWDAMAACRDTRCDEGCGFTADRFGCAGEFAWTDVVAGETGKRFQVGYIVEDFTTYEPVEGARVRLCSVNDVDCEAAIDEAVTDEQGLAYLSVPLDRLSGSVKYYADIELENADGILRFLHQPFGSQYTPNGEYLVRSTPIAQVETITAALGFSGCDFEKGVLQAILFDCDSTFSTDMTVEMEGVPPENLLYGTDPKLKSTDSKGLATACGVGAGVTSTTVRKPDGSILSRRPLLVREGWITQAWLTAPEKGAEPEDPGP